MISSHCVKLKRLLQDKIKLFETEQKLTGQLVNYWLMEACWLDGKDVRMSGQDVRRGTFSHRHAVLRG